MPDYDTIDPHPDTMRPLMASILMGYIAAAFAGALMGALITAAVLL